MVNKLTAIKLKQPNVLDKLQALTQGTFRQRAEIYDKQAAFPAENFDDLFSIDALAAPVGTQWGGLGWSPVYGKIYMLWQMTRAIAKADLSFARCWEGHNNALMILDCLADDSQKQRWFNEVVTKGVRWAAWSGEPQSTLPGQKYQIGTCIEQHQHGYVLNGNKVFATSAAGADRAILLVSLAGPGGARTLTNGENTVLMLACDLSDPSISFDDSWWDPLGMRSTVSYKVNFNDTFIPFEDAIGEAGAFLTHSMQSYFSPHYGVSFLGALDGAYEYTLEAIQTQPRREDPYVQHRIAQIKLNIETLELWLTHVAYSLDHQEISVTARAASKFRYLAEQFAEEGVKHCIKICGARSLNKPSYLERTYRDLSIYVQHDNADHILATIGRDELGLASDKSFFKLKV